MKPNAVDSPLDIVLMAECSYLTKLMMLRDQAQNEYSREVYEGMIDQEIGRLNPYGNDGEVKRAKENL